MKGHQPKRKYLIFFFNLNNSEGSENMAEYLPTPIMTENQNATYIRECLVSSACMWVSE